MKASTALMLAREVARPGRVWRAVAEVTGGLVHGTAAEAYLDAAEEVLGSDARLRKGAFVIWNELLPVVLDVAASMALSDEAVEP